MELNFVNFQTSLANIFNVDKKLVVLKQGNWYNPQSTSSKPKTWIAFNILRNKPVTIPCYREDEDEEINVVEVTKEAEIDLQFIGTQSEDLANNVATWLLRQDVKDELDNYDGHLMVTDMSAWSSDYFLDGLNVIKAWNVKIFIVWVSKTQTSQYKWEQVKLEGGFTNG